MTPTTHLEILLNRKLDENLPDFLEHFYPSKKSEVELDFIEFRGQYSNMTITMLEDWYDDRIGNFIRETFPEFLDFILQGEIYKTDIEQEFAQVAETVVGLVTPLYKELQNNNGSARIFKGAIDLYVSGRHTTMEGAVKAAMEAERLIKISLLDSIN